MQISLHIKGEMHFTYGDGEQIICSRPSENVNGIPVEFQWIPLETSGISHFHWIFQFPLEFQWKIKQDGEVKVQKFYCHWNSSEKIPVIEIPVEIFHYVHVNRIPVGQIPVSLEFQ